jgi:hypothetical protein
LDPNPPLLIIGFLTAKKNIYKGLKTWTDLLSLKKTTYYHKDEKSAIPSSLMTSN